MLLMEIDESSNYSECLLVFDIIFFLLVFGFV